MSTQDYTKSLTALLKDICPVEATWDRAISGLSNNSRTVKPGDLFFAYPGAQADGRDFIQAAIEKGACAVLAEANEASPKMELRNGQANYTVPVLFLSNVRAQISEIAARFYENPAQMMSVIGVTGTSGKTSCTQFIASALQMENKRCGVMGTLGNGLYNQLEEGDLTTADAITIQKLLADLRAKNATHVAMEVSSHGLAQGRVRGIPFMIGVFTNLSQDHLDYHGDMENYASAKRLLFSQPGLRYAVLNVDDPCGLKWSQELENHLPVYTYSTHSQHKLHRDKHIAVYHSVCNDGGITASIHTPWGEGVLHNPYLIGQFNLSNLLAALTVLNILGVPLQKALAHLAQLRGVSGRMQRFGGGKQPLVIVDYAHKPGALEQVLITLRAQCAGRLWCVFGCGGNRDKSKRPLMAKIAEKYADRVIITDDNPRNEEKHLITADILAGFAQPKQIIVEHDRRRAIAHAIECAQVGDIVLIAGKGHENYQLIGSEKLPFSDSVEVQMCLAEKTT